MTNWVITAVLTGKMPRLSNAEQIKFRELFKTLGDLGGVAAQEVLVKNQEAAYAARKASGLDNSQKNAAVIANLATIAVGVFALIFSDFRPAQAWLVVSAIALMGLGLIVSYVMYMPKGKNWVHPDENENTFPRAMDILETVVENFTGKPEVEVYEDDVMSLLLEEIYMEAIDGETHWNHLLILERREFSLVCLFGILGILLTALAFVI